MVVFHYNDTILEIINYRRKSLLWLCKHLVPPLSTYNEAKHCKRAYMVGKSSSLQEGEERKEKKRKRGTHTPTPHTREGGERGGGTGLLSKAVTPMT